jgi:glycosyltransferase involved in cell wall biosynthesis
MTNSVVIVPAFNEGPRISLVLEALSQSLKQGIIKKIIVVDDGSRDNTSEQVRKFSNIELIRFDKNKGKDSALLAGFRRAIEDKAEFALTIDADLKGLTTKNISDLVESIKSNDMSIGTRANIYHGAAWREWLTLNTGGERIFRTSTLSEVINNPHFIKFMKKRRGLGIDLALSIIYQQTGRKITTVNLPGVVHTSKKIKSGKIKGRLQNFAMNMQFIKSGLAARRTARKMRIHSHKLV